MRVSPHKAQALQRPVDPTQQLRVAELPPRYAPAAARPLCGLAANRRPATPRLRVRRLLSQPSFAFPLQDGSPCFLASEHLLDVCSLSGRAKHPYPTRYKPAFASSSILSRSANRSPCGSPARVAGRLIEVSTFRFISSRGGRCLLSAGEHWRSRRVAVLGPFRLPHLLVQAYQLVWLARA